MNNSFETVDEYINSFPNEVQILLNNIRACIRQVAVNAEERMSYGMPSYKIYGKPLVYFAAFKNHIGFYATPSGHAAFAEKLAKYKQGKGSVQFPIKEPIPLDLIKKITDYRLKENKAKAEL
ncbi:MAG TPA: DUF1801 domain-containing protein [Chitinophagaceae bacterium]|jgi:uncharacterized protein YdhG (YjbR/CyaY superfamily)|nr:DUF1801 domain-containing protein [Chitinophagaceae bacterium]